MMETVNLKTAITFRVKIGSEVASQICAFTTKTFRGERNTHYDAAKPSDHIPYRVHDILIEGSQPWYTLQEPLGMLVLSSNILSRQPEAA